MCKFSRAGIGMCKEQNVIGSDFCEKHNQEKCCVCGAQATHGCEHLGQFVCGYPLCGNCEGYTDTSNPSGNWGFLNHGHRKKNKI